MEHTFTNIYNNNLWSMNQSESRSGLGSTNEYTANIQSKLVNFIRANNVSNVLDTSCGDWNWMKHIKDIYSNKCAYTGIDIVEKIVNDNISKFSNGYINFIHSDFLSYLKQQDDNSIDLILCRHTLEHLPEQYNLEFLKEAKRVCKYLFVTSYISETKYNSNISSNDISPYRPILLNKHPYNVYDEFLLETFYDGPNTEIHPEMSMNIYKFIK